jgi:Protein of unknown function (DUF1571)
MARWIGFGLAMVLLPLVGCATGDRQPATQPAPRAAAAADSDNAMARYSQDPMSYLRDALARCERLESYTTTFVREERRGLGPFKSLQAPERIACWFRRSPLSIRMKWLDPSIKYGESTYVEGADRNRVRFIPRHGLFGLPPGIVRVSVDTPVTWGEARYRVTEFGVETLIRQTIATIEAENGAAMLTFEPLATLPDSSKPARRLRIDYPRDRHAAPIQELYFDSRTELPLLTQMRFPSGAIDTAYAFEDLNAAVAISDADFLLEIERPDGDVHAASGR